jgi:hypothetical protein
MVKKLNDITQMNIRSTTEFNFKHVTELRNKYAYPI